MDTSATLSVNEERTVDNEPQPVTPAKAEESKANPKNENKKSEPSSSSGNNNTSSSNANANSAKSNSDSMKELIEDKSNWSRLSIAF